jgi:hypothetical protein
MKIIKDSTQDKIKLIQILLKNPYSKYAVAIFGGMLALFLGGKLMRLFSGLIVDYKMLKSAIRA